MMKTNFDFSWKTLSSILLLLVMACASCAPPAQPAEPIQTRQPDATETSLEVEPTTTSQPKATATESEQATQEPENVVPTNTEFIGPFCTVLQDLNVRSGPGTAYDPPIDVLLANSEVIPVAYNPVGYPGGGWVHVEDSAGRTMGWVSGGSDYVSCNIDLTTLTSVDVVPPLTDTLPPAPNRPSAQTTNRRGDCGQGHAYECEVVFSDGVPIQFLVIKDGQVIGGAEGVGSVEFEVRLNGNTIYSHTEETSAYCMFGGDEPCSSWVFEDNVYKWGSGGAVVQAGEYSVRIQARFNIGASDLRWTATVTVEE